MRYVSIWLSVVLSAILLAGCAGGGSSPDDEVRGVPEIRVAQAPAVWDTAQASSLESLVAATGDVFVGEVTRALGERTTPVPSSSALKASIPVTSFEVRVTTAMVGKQRAGDTVVFDQPYGVVEQSDGPVLLFLEGDSPLEVGQSYLFFAAARDDGTFTSAPFARFEASDQGEFEALEGWQESGAAKELAGATASEAEARLGEPE